MPQLMGQGHDVAELVCEVHQNVGMSTRDSAAAEGAAALPRSQLRIDPVLLEELPNYCASPRTERFVAGLDNTLGFLPVAGWQITEKGRVAVVIIKLVDAEQFALQSVVSLHGRMVALGRGHEGIDDGLADFVRQMTWRHRVPKMA